MLNYTQLYIRIWSDKKFKLLPSADEQCLFIYLIANEQTTKCGIYEIDSYLMNRVKTTKPIEEVFKNITDSALCKFDEKTDMVYLPNKFKWIGTKSTKVINGMMDELNQIDHPFKQMFIDKYKPELDTHFRIGLHDYIKDSHELENDEVIKQVLKLYDNKLPNAKRFLMNRGCKEERIDEIIGRVYPQLAHR